jgi:hypothetical protein
MTFSDGSHYLSPREIQAAYRRGVGNLDPQNQQIAGIAATAATTTAGMLVALGTIGGPVGAAIAGVAAIGIAIANVFSGCGQTCIAATTIDNQLEPVLAQNLGHYMSSPIHYRSLQQAALNNFDIAWAAYVKAEQGVPTQGAISIAERQAGGCHWTTSPGGWQGNTYVSPGASGSGSACWNWFIGYRDPIANDPTVVPDPTPVDQIGSSLSSIFGTSGTGGASMAPLLLLGGAAIAAMILLDN